ncbi:MAG: fimbria/pilus periplasmic chaperone [Pelomonas sp.]|nr:fimbria/pilus periplasmic chaperone [Roseateles sp.]
MSLSQRLASSLRAAALGLVGMAAVAAHAGVIIIGTRVVYPSDARDVNVRLTNNGTTPALVQAWIDDGDPAMNAETAKVPFVLTPPLARIDKAKSQTLRLIYTGQGLPQDRETLFWLNVLEVPPKPEEGTNYLQFAVRTRIKVFYRPASLHKGEPSDSVSQVGWQFKSTDAKSVVIEATNPSPYYLSLSQFRLVAGGKEVGSPMNVTLRPKSTESITVADADIDPKALSGVKYQVINDFGAMVEGEKSLTSRP